MTSSPIIVGAGLAGLIAAHAWPRSRVVERMPEPTALHKALLRFRTDAVARLTGIEFRQVRVRKGIWHDGAYRQPDIRLANWYAQKCTGHIVAERSIWNLEPVERYIAPLDLYEQLVSSVGSRISWGEDCRDGDWLGGGQVVVSTAPLSESIQFLKHPPNIVFRRAPILVQRFMLSETTNIHQTVYFPDPDCPMYRASITGSVLICEFAGEPSPGDVAAGKYHALVAFGIQNPGDLLPMGDVKQQFGKIAPIDENARRQALFRLTHEHNIYSLGRFATWRNILLDDVVKDVDVVKRMMRSDPYHRLQAS